MPETTVGFIGLGKMGRPMSRNIMSGGYPLVVANRSQQVVQELAAEGATAAASAAELAAKAEIVCLCLPVPATVEEVVLGPGGVAEGIKPGSIVVDFSTIGPGTCRSVARALEAKGVAYLDAPVSGGTTGAEAGTLTVMVGGDQAEYERALPVLQRVGKKIVYAGPVGAGAVVKLMNQLLVGINLAGAAEAMVLGTKAGVDPTLLLETIASATGNSFQLQRCFPDMVLKGNFDAMFSVDLLHKDLGLGVEVGKENRVRLLLGALAVQVFEEAREAGFGEQDIAAVIRPLEALAKVEVRA
ncbi:MAG TPA: NAD(P)-dependent oxidoreductase [Chloroflexota bacterium]|jgi:3-hydroxyisobutyrate dehydrogenase|nr:NAD(P)-dependent oxidoreductase [Chloroflexota bacterium]